jgi:hypothetical protein
VIRVGVTFRGDLGRTLEESFSTENNKRVQGRLAEHESALKAALSRGSSMRGGIQHDFLPYVSSAQYSTEWPQEQSGNLLSSISFEQMQGTDAGSAFGYFYDKSNKLTYDSSKTSPTLSSLSSVEFDEKVQFLEFGFFSADYGPLTRYFETEKLFRGVENKYGGSG